MRAPAEVSESEIWCKSPKRQTIIKVDHNNEANFPAAQAGMWTDGIILLGALICAILFVAVVEKVKAEATSSLNKWKSSELWKDLPEVPAKWGEQYDLNLERDCGLQDAFVPIVTMPEEMIGDLFARQPLTAEEPKGMLDRGRTVLKDLVSKATTGIKEKLDEAAGKVESMMNGFQKKKTDAIKNIKEKLDIKTDGTENHLKQASKEVGCEEPAKHCLENTKEAFEEYEGSLQQAMNPCLNDMKDAIKGHESRIDAAKREVNELLKQLKNCSQGNPTSGGVKERLSAVFGSIQCTTKTITNQIKNQLGTALKKLTDAVKKAGTLKKELDDAKKCIDVPPNHDLVEKQEAKLVGKFSQCK